MTLKEWNELPKWFKVSLFVLDVILRGVLEMSFVLKKEIGLQKETEAALVA
jgi:hypothetical protein